MSHHLKWDEERGTYIKVPDIKLPTESPDVAHILDAMDYAYLQGGPYSIATKDEVIISGIAGGLINPTTGKLADDDGKALDSNGWRKV